MKIIFDAYDWRARVTPAFLVSLPIFLSLFTCFNWPAPVLGKILDGSIWLMILLGLTIPVRNAGNSLEKKLWESWGGPPSTLIMRWSHNKIGKELKKQYHEAVRNYLNLPMPSETDELRDKDEADKSISQAFKRVRAILREKDPKGLWAIDNAHYGLHRNLLGSRKLWVTLTTCGIFVNGFLAFFKGGSVIVAGLAGNIAILFFAIYLGWRVLPKSVLHVASRYAENSWGSFLNIAMNELRGDK